MHRMHGSMMDAAGARPHEPVAAGHAHRRHALATPLHWAPMAHAWALHGALARVAQQQSAQALTAGAALPRLAWDPEAWRDTCHEAMAFAESIGRHALSLQSMWLEGLGEWADEASQLRRANTVTKLVDQEMNLVQQGLALLANQATATTRLAENIQANLGFWLASKAQQAGTG